MRKKISPKKYAWLLRELTAGVPEKKLPSQISDFIGVLKKNNHLRLLNQIVFEFEKIWQQENGIVKVEMATAKILPADELKKIVGQLQEQLKLKVEVTTAINPELVGGAIFKYDDKLIDASVRKQLTQLRQRLVA